MRKMIIPIILVLLSLVSVNAQWSPLPISGRIYAESPDGLTVRATNLRSGVSMITTANGAGEYMIEWANSPGSLKYNVTDVFKVEILDCISDSKCTQSIVYTGQPELFLTFDLFDVDIPTVTTITVTTVSCPECQFTSCSSCCPDCSSCPTCPTCETCPTCPTCPTTDYTPWVAALIGAIAVIFGGLIKKYTPYKGKTKIETYIKKDGNVGYRFYSYEQYTTKSGTLSSHWVKKKEW